MSQPPYLVSQQGSVTVPESDRLDEAVLWNYSFSFGFEGDTAFEVTYNEDRTTAYTMALHDADGIAEVRVTASAGAVPVVGIEDMRIVPVEGGYRYQTSGGDPLAYDDARLTRTRTVVLERLDAIDVQSARASVQGISFAEPTLPFVQNVQQIDVGGASAGISVHLTSLVQTLLGNSPFASQPTSIECRYAYTIGGVSIEAPVVLVARQDVAIGFDEQLMEQVEAAIRQWLGAVQPPAADARLVFALTFWSAIAQTDAPLLRLTNLSLAMTDVAL